MLITDLFEGGDQAAMLRRVADLTAAGTQVIVLLALYDDGAPAYNHDMAAALAELGRAGVRVHPGRFRRPDGRRHRTARRRRVGAPPGGPLTRRTARRAADQAGGAGPGYCRLARLQAGSPACSCMASRLSRAGCAAAAGPSAKARRMFAVVRQTNDEAAPSMPCGRSP